MSNCGQVQRMGPVYCVREPGHHGACLTESGRRYHQATLRHADNCEGCEAEYVELDRQRAERRRP